MKKIYNVLGLLLCLAMVIGSFAGCGSKPDAGEANSQDSKSEDPKDVVTLQFWYQGTDDITVDFNEKWIAEFNKNHPNIRVEGTGMSNTISDQETMLNAAVLSDTYPDVIGLVLAEVGSRGSLGDLEPLQLYVDAWDDKDNLYSSAYSMGLYEGNQVALGYYPNPQIWVYRKDAFKEAGLDPEVPPASWEEMKEDAVKLTKYDENGTVVFAGMDVPTSDTSLVFTEPFMRSAGSKVIDETNLTPSFTDEGAIAALDFIGELSKLNISIPHDQQKSDERPFINGKAAMSNLSIGNIATFKANNPDVELGYIDLIHQKAGDKGAAFCGYQLYALGQSGKHKDEAWEFLSYMLSDEVVWDRYETFNTPIVKYSLEDKYMSSGDDEYNKAIMNYVENGKGKAAVSWISSANKYLSNAYEQVVYGKMDAKEALEEAQTQLQAEIK